MIRITHISFSVLVDFKFFNNLLHMYFRYRCLHAKLNTLAPHLPDNELNLIHKFFQFTVQ